MKEKTVVRPEAHTLEAEYEKHIKWDEILGRPHDHKTVIPTPRSSQVSGEVRNAKKVIRIVLFLIVLFTVLTVAMAILFEEYGNDIGASLFGSPNPLENMEVTAGAIEEIHTAGDFEYTVYGAYRLVSSQEAADYFEVEIPSESKLAIVALDMAYSGDNELEYDERTMPYVYDGKDYRESADPSALAPVLEAFGVEDLMISGYDVYMQGSAASGYLAYLVDEDADMITVCCECKSGDTLGEIYEVSVPLQEVE